MTDRHRAAKPVNRDGFWYLHRRVPRQYAAIENRRVVSWSTGIPVWQDPHGIRAAEIIRERDIALFQYWRDKAGGLTTQSPEEFRAITARAAQLNLSYCPAHEVASADLNDLFRRFMALTCAWGETALTRHPPTPQIQTDLTAALGGLRPPVSPSRPKSDGPMVSDMLTEYININAPVVTQKSPRQLHKFKTSRQVQLDLFISLIGGDKPFADLTRADARKLREHWNNRIIKGETQINSANRCIREVSGLYSSIKDYLQIDGPGIFDKLVIPGGQNGKRLSFDPAFVQERYLANGVFDELNPEARRILYLIIETGLRLSEACNLTKETICLDHPIPYVDIQQHNRVTKTPESVRQIPLVGVALMAMREQPNGFPRYYDNSDTASVLINKAIDLRGLRPAGKKQSLYSMRHTIIDRLKAVEAPSNIQEDMLGHKHMYGQGTTLEHRHRWLQIIAFKPPATV